MDRYAAPSGWRDKSAVGDELKRAWETLDSFDSADGQLVLLRRGERDFLITLGGRVLMNSFENRSEIALAEVACRSIAGGSSPRVLIGGLGMGCTLRASLDALPASAQLTVVELHSEIAAWCRGPLAPLSSNALSDPRVVLEIGDVADTIRRRAEKPDLPRFDAILIDLFEGPHAHTKAVRDPFYGRRALARTASALSSEGRFCVWGEAPDAGFEDRLRRAGFSVERRRPGRGGKRHAVTLARRKSR